MLWFGGMCQWFNKAHPFTGLGGGSNLYQRSSDMCGKRFRAGYGMVYRPGSSHKNPQNHGEVAVEKVVISKVASPGFGWSQSQLIQVIHEVENPQKDHT